MAKCIVKTTGQFMLSTDDGYIFAQVPTVIERNQFVGSRIGLGQLQVLAEVVPPETTQEQLVAFKGTVEEFVKSLNKPVEDPKTQAKKKTV